MEIQKILFPEVGRCTEKELYFRTEQECSSVSGDIPDEQTLFENEKKALAAVENNKKDRISAGGKEDPDAERCCCNV